MAFVVVSWTNGDTITEVKLDQMVANDVHLLDLATRPQIVNESDSLTGEVAINLAVPSTQLQIDGSDLGSGSTGSGDHVESDLDISGYSVGIHELTMIIKTLTGSGATARTLLWRFYKAAECDYLTAYYTLTGVLGAGGTGTRTLGTEAITVIIHKDAESWT